MYEWRSSMDRDIYTEFYSYVFGDCKYVVIVADVFSSSLYTLSQCTLYIKLHAYLKSQKRPTKTMFVYKIQANPIHTILKYGNYNDFMDS